MIRRLLLVCLLLLPVAIVQAQDEPRVIRYDGALNNSTPSRDYTLSLFAGDSALITAEAISGDLDTVITLYNPDGRLVASNDDRSDTSLDSAIGYQATADGDYRLSISRYLAEEGTSAGSYALTITIGEESVLLPLDELTGLELSGERLRLDTENFRIHYTLTGSDAVTEAYVAEVARAVEEMYRMEIEILGWAPPPSDGFLGGNALYDVYIKDLIGSGEGALGYVSPRMIVGDNPNTEAVEINAGASFMALDNDFADTTTNAPLSLMRATVAHEYHHAIQFGYDSDDAHGWMYEATAVWMETQAAGKEQDATGYIEYAYQYPELCFGTLQDPGQGQLQYGEWTFVQMMADDFGTESVIQFWEDIAQYSGFEALATTLERYGDTIPSALARYRLKNLAREYDLAPLFNATVWRENVISNPGRWTFTGRGIQELGANYFELTLEPGAYYFGLINDGGRLELWGVGVRLSDGKVEAMPLGRGGTFDTTDYDHAYVMVFNPLFDENLDDCVYYDYDLDVTPAKAARNATRYQFRAEHFAPLSSP
jgi:hypothetical protein